MATSIDDNAVGENLAKSNAWWISLDYPKPDEKPRPQRGRGNPRAAASERRDGLHACKGKKHIIESQPLPNTPKKDTLHGFKKIATTPNPLKYKAFTASFPFFLLYIDIWCTESMSPSVR